MKGKLTLSVLLSFVLFIKAHAQTTFSYTGSVQTYTVTTGTTSLSVDLQGACGGSGAYARGGYGGRVQCILAVTAGEVLNIYVGAAGQDYSAGAGGGYNGGGHGSGAYTAAGGGGATDIRVGGTALSNRFVVAGGGGGGGFLTTSTDYERGGDGGSLTGDSGYIYNAHNFTLSTSSGTGAAGGTTTAGGYEGFYWTGSMGYGAFAGILGGGGWCNITVSGGGGGGGGYYGGGGGSNGGGGGGSSYANSTYASSVIHTKGYNTTGNGIAIIVPFCGAVTGLGNMCVGNTTTLSDTGGGGTGIWMSTNTAVATIGSLTGIISGVSAGTATIDYILPSLGCITESPFVVDPLPSGLETISPNPDCSGTAVTFTSGAPLCSLGDLSFNGTSSSAIHSGVASTATNNITLEAWVKWSGSGSTQTIIENGTNGTNGYQLFANSSGVLGCDVGSVATMTSSAALPSGVWAHVALVRNSGTWTLYLNDVSYTLSSSGTTPVTPSGSFCVGSNQASGQVFSGAIDEVKFWTIVRSSTDIGADMIACNTAPQTGLAGYWKFDEGTGSVTADGSGYGNTLTLSSTTWGTSGEPLSSYVWSYGDGSAGATTASASHSYSVSGTYTTTLTVTSSYGCVSSTVAVVTVNTVPASITGTANVCNGSTITMSDITTGGAWTSSNTTLATIGSAGMVTGITPGVDTIRYTLSTGCLAIFPVTVNRTPSVPYISGGGPPYVCLGSSVTLADSVTSGAWSTAAVDISIGSATGIVTGTATGIASVTYTSSLGCKAAAIVTVNPLPSVITGAASVCIGSSSTLTDSISGGIWSSSYSGYASVGSATGIITGASAGITLITYALPSGCYRTLLVTANVLPGAISGLSSLCVGQSTSLSDGGGGAWSSGSTLLSVGSATGTVYGVAGGSAIITYTLPTGCLTTEVFTVYPTPSIITGFTNLCVGNTTPLADSVSGGMWISSDYSTADINATTGLVTGIAGGIAVISYILPSGCAATKVVTVNPSAGTISGISSVCVGGATNLYSIGGIGTWSSSDVSKATINASTGLVTGIATGTATMTFTVAGGCMATQTVNIVPGVSPITGSLTVCQGSTTILGDATTGGTWGCAPSTTAIISTGGTVTGVLTGVAVVSYTVSGCSSSAIVTVNPLPAAISGLGNVCQGGTITLTDAGGAWSATPITTGTISGTGALAGISSGTVMVVYTLPTGCANSKIITVNPLPAAISGPSSVCVGQTITLTDGGGGTWSKSNTNANIGSVSGVVTGVIAGADIITYTLPITGCYIARTVTVSTSAGVIGGTPYVCVASTTILTDAGGGIWSSGSSAISIGSSSGTVTGITAGTAAVTYSIGSGCSTSTTVTVNPLPVPIAIGSSICPGGSITLSGPTGGVWSSGAVSVGSATGVVTGTTAGTPTITYTLPTGCYRTATITINPTPPLPGGPSALCVGAHITLTESGSGTWLSGSTGVATIGATTGNITGMATGTSNITFTSTAGCPVTTTITVSLSPTAITGPSGVCAGAAITLTDTVGGGLWSTASSSATVGSLSGIVSGSGSGTAMITYSLGSGCTVTKAVTVSAAPAAILGSATICMGTTTSLTDATTGGTWSITPTTTGTISASGVVTGIAAGTAYVNYSIGSTGSLPGCSVNDTVTVNTAPTAIGGPASVCQGATIIETNGTTGGAWSTASSNISMGSTSSPSCTITGINAGSAIITYSIGSCTVNRNLLINPSTPITGGTGLCVHNTTILSDATTGGAWAITPTSTATITGSGTVTGVAAGAATVTYTTTAGCKTTTTVNVSTTPSAVTGLLHVCIDGTITLTDSAAGGVWSDIPPAIIFLGSSDGLVTGLHSGTQLITYSLGTGCSVNVTVTVDTPPAAISGTMSVCPGQTTSLSDVTPGGGWSSGTPGTATVDSRGVVTGIAAGVAAISYLPVSGCAATANITVNPLPNNITGTTTVCEGMTTTLTDTATGGTWSAGSSATAIVGSTTGVVTGGTAGTAIITYTLPTGCAIATSVYVNTAPVAITGATNMCLGSGTVLSDASAGGTWSTPTTGIIILGSTGSVTGIGLGSATVSYTIGGCAVTDTVNVNSLPAAITGSNHVCADSRDTLADATTGGVWSSSNPLVAAVGTATGEVTGIIPGTVTVSYSMGVGCTVNKTVSVSPLPASITGPDNICMGSTTTLHDATTGGSWSSSAPATTTVTTSGVVSGISGGIGIISYTSPATGCAAVYPVSVIQVPAITGVNNICAWGDTMTVHDSLAGGSFTSTLVTVSDSGAVLAYGPGTATITYTESHGCFVTATLTVNPLPAEIAGNPRICQGSTVTLTDATTGGSWTSGTTAVATVPPTIGTVTGVATGSSIITYTLPITGCRQVFTVTVQIPPSPISGAANLCVGATTILGDTASGGAWTSGSTAIATVGATSGVVHGLEAGTATITYTMGSLCTATAIVTVNALPTIYTVTGGGNYCSSATGVHIGLSNSGTGINYQLYDGTTATGAATAGTGHTLDFGLLTGAGVYTVMATNSATSCASNMAGSATITITPSVTPIMNITATPGTTLCAGTAVSLTSLTTNGGATPQYQWTINGANVTGATSATYSYTPSAGDVITATLTSDAQCATPASVTSNTVTMTVNPELTPVTVITAIPGSPILIGETETFTATVTNGGTGATYQWKINGIAVPGATNAGYVTTNISNGDTVTCTVTSGTPCGGNTASSNKLGITVVNNVGVATHSFTEGDITVLPNPNKGTFSIKGTIGTTDEEVHIVITDMLGQQVYTTTATTHSGILNEQVQLSNTIANGMYLLSIHTTAGNRVFHVVVAQ